MDRRTNDRGYTEQFYKKRHLKLNELRQKNTSNEYLHAFNTIPKHPENVLFQASYLRHDTNLSGFLGIMDKCGFKTASVSTRPGLVWWSLDISREDIRNAEDKYLKEHELYPPEERFLHKFTSSPAFLSSSRLGNFRFRMSIDELLQFYKHQFCNGQDPYIRIFETVVYKQEVMYSILIHGPNALDLFFEYPELKDFRNAVCVLHDNTIHWCAQAISKTHSFKLSCNMKARWIVKRHHKYYVWDHVGVAFHVPHGEVFSFRKEKLEESLRLCKGAEPNISNEEFVECDFNRIRP